MNSRLQPTVFPLLVVGILTGTVFCFVPTRVQQSDPTEPKSVLDVEKTSTPQDNDGLMKDKVKNPLLVDLKPLLNCCGLDQCSPNFFFWGPNFFKLQTITTQFITGLIYKIMRRTYLCIHEH